MKIVEIFNSIEGEGKRAGLPCTFIRLYGCNLSCSYCDSQYACTEEDNARLMSIPEILHTVKMLDCPNVTVTGGEPLIHPGIVTLLRELLHEGYWVNVETNGSCLLPIFHDNLFYTVDFKTNASEMSDKMKPATFYALDEDDVVKFVVGSTDDLEQSLEFVEKHYLEKPQIYVSPVFGQIGAYEIVDFIKYHKLWNWKTQLQLHKYIWQPDQRGV